MTSQTDLCFVGVYFQADSVCFLLQIQYHLPKIHDPVDSRSGEKITLSIKPFHIRRAVQHRERRQ